MPKLTISSINVLYEKYHIKYCTDKQSALSFHTRRDLAKKAFEKLLVSGIDFICLQRNGQPILFIESKTPAPAILRY